MSRTRNDELENRILLTFIFALKGGGAGFLLADKYLAEMLESLASIPEAATYVASIAIPATLFGFTAYQLHKRFGSSKASVNEVSNEEKQLTQPQSQLRYGAINSV